MVAKAPVAGEVKTRLGASIGPRAAAEVAAAALLDTLDACEAAFGAARCQLALAGDLSEAARGAEIRERIDGWRVIGQRGEGFGARLANAHADAAGPVVQIGMDTPQATAAQLIEAAAGLADHDAVLGPAEDGGWWVLALRDPAHAHCLSSVAMSTHETYNATLAVLREHGLRVATTVAMRDVDDLADADAVAAAAPATRFARAWRAVAAG